jgi:hypothetical protein
MNRRGFLSALFAAPVVAAVDPERLLWTPGQKLISIPSAVGGNQLLSLQAYCREALKALREQLHFAEMCTPFEPQDLAGTAGIVGVDQATENLRSRDARFAGELIARKMIREGHQPIRNRLFAGQELWGLNGSEHRAIVVSGDGLSLTATQTLNIDMDKPQTITRLSLSTVRRRGESITVQMPQRFTLPSASQP